MNDSSNRYKCHFKVYETVLIFIHIPRYFMLAVLLYLIRKVKIYKNRFTPLN